MSRDTRNDFALAMQRLRADRYIDRQHSDDLRTIEAAYHDGQATIKQSLKVALAGLDASPNTLAARISWTDAVVTEARKIANENP